MSMVAERISITPDAGRERTADQESLRVVVRARFFGQRPRRRTFFGEYEAATVEVRATVSTDEVEAPAYFVELANTQGDTFQFLLSEDEGGLRGDDGRLYPLSGEEIQLVKRVAEAAAH